MHELQAPKEVTFNEYVSYIHIITKIENITRKYYQIVTPKETFVTSLKSFAHFCFIGDGLPAVFEDRFDGGG